MEEPPPHPALPAATTATRNVPINDKRLFDRIFILTFSRRTPTVRAQRAPSQRLCQPFLTTPYVTFPLRDC